MSNEKLQYTIELVDNFSKEHVKVFEKFTKDIEKVKKDIGAPKLKLLDENQIIRELGFFKSKIRDIRMEIAKPLTIGDAIHKVAQVGIPGKIMKSTISHASDISYGMANIEKVLPRATADELKKIKHDIDEMGKTIPKSKLDIISAYQAAAQSMPLDQVKEFLINIEQMSVAFDMSATQAASAMTIISKNLGLTNKEMKDFGDQTAYMHHHFGTAMVPQIIEATSRMSALGKSVGLTKEQMLTLSAVGLSSGVDSSRLANAVQKGMITYVAKNSNTKKGQEAFRELGVDIKEFQAISKQSKFEGLVFLLDKIKEAKEKGVNLETILPKIAGGDYFDILASISEKSEEFKHSYKALNETTVWVGEGKHAYIRMMEEEKNQAKLLVNAYENLKDVIGKPLLSPTIAVEQGLTSTLNKISELVQKFPRITQIVGIATASMITFKGSILGLRVLNTLGLLPSLKGIIPVISTISKGFFSMIPSFAQIGSGIKGIIPAITSVLRSVFSFSSILSVASMALSPMILGAIGLAAAGVLIYKNWKGIGAFFSGMFQGISSVIKPAIDSISKSFSNIWDIIKPLFGEVEYGNGKLKQLGKTGESVGRIIGYAFDAILMPINLVVKAIEKILEGIKFVHDFFSKAKSPKQNLFPNIESQIHQDAIKSLGIKDPLEGIVPIRNQQSSSSPNQTQNPFSTPKFDFSGMKERKGGIDIHVYDHKTEVKPSRNNDYNMNVKQPVYSSSFNDFNYAVN